MSTLMVLGLALTLFVLSVLLVLYETFRGVRFFETKRSEFDRFIKRIGFVLTHVDFSSFTWQLLKDFGMHVAHIALHLLLLGIRFLERTLTRTVRGIRAQKAEASSEGSLKTTSDFFKKVGERVTRLMPRKKKKQDGEGVVSSEGSDVQNGEL